MVSRSSYDELMFAYEERGHLLFEAVHLLTVVTRVFNDELVGHGPAEEYEELYEQIEGFLGRARQAGMV